MQWTKQQPTEPGFYWAIPIRGEGGATDEQEGRGPRPVKARHNEYLKRMVISECGEEEEFYVGQYEWWMGPMAIPNGPVS
jgi:hypothetical protein